MPVPELVEKDGELKAEGGAELTAEDLKKFIIECIKKSDEKDSSVHIDLRVKFVHDEENHSWWVLSGRIWYRQVDLEFERDEECEDSEWYDLKAHPERIGDVEFDVEVDAYGVYEVRMAPKRPVSRGELEEFLDKFVERVDEYLFWPATRRLSVGFDISLS